MYLSFRTYAVYPFPLSSHGNGIHCSFFCSVTSGSGDRPKEERCHGGGVYSFLPGLRPLPKARNPDLLHLMCPMVLVNR